MLPEIAKLAAEKAFEALGGAIYESPTCEEKDTAPFVTRTFCKIIGGASGAERDAWERDVTKRLEKIQESLDTISTTLDDINSSVHDLLVEMKLVALKLDEIQQGVAAAKYIQQIQARYETFKDLLGNERRMMAADPWSDFFTDVLEKDDLPQHLAVIKTALTLRSPSSDSLFRTFAKQIIVRATSEKTSTEELVRLYETFETYVTSFLVEIKKGYLLYTLAALFFDLKSQLSPNAPKREHKPVADWAAERNARLKAIVYGFNAEVLWLILALSGKELASHQRYSLSPAAAPILERVGRFTARALNEPYGLRGAVLSIAGNSDGKLTIAGTEAPVAHRAIIHAEFDTDWWTGTETKKDPDDDDSPIIHSWDQFAVTKEWEAWFYVLPESGTGTYELKPTARQRLYPNLRATVQRVDEATGKPSNKPEAINYGSFLRTDRIGGGFVMNNRDWGRWHAPVKNLELSSAPRRKEVDDTYTAFSSNKLENAFQSDDDDEPAFFQGLVSTLASGGEVEWNLFGIGSTWGCTHFARFMTMNPITAAESGLFEVEIELEPASTTQPTPGWIDLLKGKPRREFDGWIYRGPLWSHVEHESESRLVKEHFDLRDKMVARKLWFISGISTKYGCSLGIRLAVFATTQSDISADMPLPEHRAETNWDLKVDENTTKREDSVSDEARHVFRGVLEFKAGEKCYLVVQPMLNISIETSGGDFTPYLAYLSTNLVNLRVVGRKDR